MMIRILYMGRLSDAAGTIHETTTLPAHVENSQQLRVWLDERFATEGVFNDTSIRIAVDQTILVEPCDIGPAQEIAFLPPVGGG